MALRFDYRDIFKSMRLAFSLQRMWLQFVGTGVGYAGYVVLTVTSLLLSGHSLQDVVQRYGLFPCLWPSGAGAPLVAHAIFWIGSVFLVVALLVTNTAVARASFMALKGNHFYTWREALGFAMRKAGSTVLTPVSVALMAGCFLIGGWLVGFLGRIPFVGELGVAVFMPLWVIAGVVLVFLVLIAIVALILAPAIIATTDEDAFEAVFQSFSTGWSQFWRLVGYQGLTGLLAVVGFVVFAIVVKNAVVVVNDIFSFAMGEKFVALATHGQYLVQQWVFILGDWLEQIFGPWTGWFFFSQGFAPVTTLSPTLYVSSVIFALVILLVGLWVLAYPFALMNAGTMISYVVLRKLKDNENLLARPEPETETEEQGAEPPKVEAQDADREEEGGDRMTEEGQSSN